MGKSTKITVSQVKQASSADVERLLREVTEAINAAPDGCVISGSEEAVRDAVARFRQRLYERGIQLRADAAKAAFSPSAGDDSAASSLQGRADASSVDGQRDD